MIKSGIEVPFVLAPYRVDRVYQLQAISCLFSQPGAHGSFAGGLWDFDGNLSDTLN